MPATVVTPRRTLVLIGCLAASFALVAPAAHAATSTKANNADALNLASSWDTLPGPADIAQWTSTVTAANTPVLAADLAWSGIKIVSPGGLVTLGEGNTLTLGTSGIDLSTATQSLTLNCGLTLQGKQSWKAAASRTLNVAGTFTHTGAVVDFTSFTASATLGTLANDSSGILGPWATTGSATTLNYVKSTAGAIAAYTAQTAGTAGNLSNVTNAAANYSFAAAATQTANLTANTLRYTGAAASLANNGFSSTLNGLMHAGSGALTISGAGNLVIGAGKELVVNANTQSITISAPLVNNAGGPSALTFNGGAATSTLTLAGGNTHSGGTTVAAGTLVLDVNRLNLGTGPVTLAGGTAFYTTTFEGSSAAGAIPNIFNLGSGFVNLKMTKDIWLAGPVTGPGGLWITGTGRSPGVMLAGAKTFGGGVKLTPANGINPAVSIDHINSLGTGPLRTELTSTDVSAGNLEARAPLTTAPGVANPLDLAAGCRLVVKADAANSLWLSGRISGTGSLVKIGTATLTLSGANTSSGATRVVAGTLACSSGFSLGGGSLDISTGAKLQLDYTGTRRVAALTFNAGTAKPNGIYGSSLSPAPLANQNDSYFAGTGTVTVGPAFAATTTTLALTSGSTPDITGTSLTFTATVAGSTPGGSVTFYDDATPLGTGTLNGAFQATLTTSSLTLGAHAITARYEGNSANDPSVAAPLTIQVAHPAEIAGFTFPGLPPTTIAGTNITVTVPYATDVSALAPTYTLYAGATGNPLSGSSGNFTTPQTYTVTGADASTKVYTVTVTKRAASTAKDITAFSFPGLAAPAIGTNTITLTVPYGTSVTNLAPTYTVSALAVPDATFPSGTARNFTTPQTYTITAENGSTKTYTVTVTVTAASSLKDILTCSFGTLGTATISGLNITLTAPANTDLTTLAPTFTLSPFATLSPVSGTVRDFTTPVTYTVTAQNLTTKTYTVTVQAYKTWSYSASLFILTTADGANLPAGATETNFPLLVRLNSGNFTFGQAQTDGRDIRFATADGTPLSYQIEQWDAPNGAASIWVKIPTISGNARQEIRMYWGKTGVTTDSNPAAVFNAGNGFASVIHMNETLSDAVGAVVPSDTGTTLATGIIGKARNFTAGAGVNCGTNITTYPTGSNAHSTEAWIRPSAANTTVVGWGIEQGQGKVVMQLASPPHINMDCYFGGGNVSGASTLPLSQWIHVAHTYKSGEARVYVNGVQDGISTSGSMNLPSTARMYLGGWYDNYNFAGDMDEVRISTVTRSANWVKLEYENQKPLQTLVGSLVQAGSTFSATPPSVTMNEGASTTLTGQAGGAQKVYWILVKDGLETVLATDQFTLNVNAGRTTGNQSSVIRFKGIYPTETKLVDIPVTVTDTIPDPVFTLTASTSLWDGRQTMTVTPNISNLAALQTAGVANLNYVWSVAGVAVARQITAGTPTVPGVLTLTRAQGSGPMTVTLVLDNGGGLVTQTKTITVQEPASDAWVQRMPGATEKPVTGQFFARDPTGFGKIYYIGTQSGAPASVFLKVYTTDTGSDVLYATHRQSLVGTAYAFTAPVAAGKVTYKVVYGTTNSSGVDTTVATVANLVCGDAYILDGQSNAVATDGLSADATNSPWIRTYGQTNGTWGNAVRNGSDFWVGYWAYDLAVTLLATNNMPVCIINGAVGGTRIDQHQANPANHAAAGSGYTIYANLFNRVVGAKLTHGIRGIFWHQGENNSGAAAPTGDWDYKSYQQYFVDMSAAWKQDYPNIQRYIIYQVWPNPCSMGGKESSDMLREVQRTLPRLYSKMSILSTIGLSGYLGCHFDASGYQAIADVTAPLVQRDHYGATPAAAVTAPNLQRAWFTSPNKNEIALEFDQYMAWNSFSTVNFYLDRVAGKVTGGSATGKVVKLTLNGTSTNQTIGYVVDQYWNGSAGNLLTGTNARYALTFYGVPIEPPTPLMVVEQPVGTSLGDGTSTVDFGTQTAGLPATRTFTIRNTGTGNLTGIAAAIDGTATGDFVVTTSPVATLAPGASTTCTVTFTASLNGPRNAGLHFASNDAQRSPFDIALTGQGNRAPVVAGYALSGVTGQAVTIYPAKLLARATDPDGDALTLTRVFSPTAKGGTVALAGTITYTPPGGLVGTDTFEVEVTDARGATARGSVTITLTPVPTGDAALGLNLTSLRVHDGKADMVFVGIPGRAYLIQRSSDLTNWSDLATVTAGPDGKVHYTDPAPLETQGFYRTRHN